MVEIRAKTIKEAFPLILNRILTFGERVDIKSEGKIVETLEYPEPIITRIENPQTDMIPKGSFWPSKLVLDKYASDVINNTKTNFDYTYGERLRAFEVVEDNEDYLENVYYDQLEYIADKLARDRTSRQAVASLWKVETDVMGGNPPCCLVVDESRPQVVFRQGVQVYHHRPHSKESGTEQRRCLSLFQQQGGDLCPDPPRGHLQVQPESGRAAQHRYDRICPLDRILPQLCGFLSREPGTVPHPDDFHDEHRQSQFIRRAQP